MKKLLILIPALFLTWGVFGQAAWIEPNPANVNQEVKLMMDVSQPDCECPSLLNLDAAGDSLFLWTWEPTENATIPNGQWNGSTQALKMTSEGNNIWSYSLVPTEFYQVDASEVYDIGISFLVKKFDGSAVDGVEPKSADQHVEVKPLGCVDKVCAFPQYFQDDDYLTVIYDNNLEERPSMQNLEAEGLDCYFLPTAVAGGVNYQYTTNNFDGSTPLESSYPELKMTLEGEGKYAFTLLPEAFFRSENCANQVPEGVKIEKIIMMFRKSNFNGQFTSNSELEAINCE